MSLARQPWPQAAVAALTLLLPTDLSGDEASIAIDPMPPRYHLTLVDRAGIGHRTTGQWDASTAIALAWNAAIEPRPLRVGLRAQAAHRREGPVRAEQGTLSLEVGAVQRLSSRWSVEGFAGYGSGILLLRGDGLATDARHRLATVSFASATVGARYALSERLAVGAGAGFRYESVSDRWTRGGVTGREFGPALSASLIRTW
ncbi:MAG: hypothetical protein H0V44_06605 [Planctomycetes bacterium]|nr:hypothetical protein [Planctomycetota bacterium]